MRLVATVTTTAVAPGLRLLGSLLLVVVAAGAGPDSAGLPAAAAEAAKAAGSCAGFPKIIHQSWKTRQLPDRFQAYAATWTVNHPSWQYVLWTDDDNRQLAEAHFPWFLETYDSFKKGVMRADTARYMYMYVLGGVYADMDIESLRPLDSLLRRINPSAAEDVKPPSSKRAAAPKAASAAGPVAAVALMGDDLKFAHNIPNAFMASAPGHPLWLEVLRAVQDAAAGATDEEWVEDVTGPVVLKAAVARYLGLAANRSALGGAALASGEGSAGTAGRKPASSELGGSREAGQKLAAAGGRGGGEAAARGAMESLKRDALAPVPANVAVPPDAGRGALRNSVGGSSSRGGKAEGAVVYVLRPGLIYPYDWHAGRPDFGSKASRALWRIHKVCSAWENPRFDPAKCRELVAGPRAYAITYWAHSWDKKPRSWRLPPPLTLAAAAVGACLAVVALLTWGGRARAAVLAAAARAGAPRVSGAKSRVTSPR